MSFKAILGAVVLSASVAIGAISTLEVQAGMRATMTGKIVEIKGSKLILNDGNGQVIVDTKLGLLKQANFAVGDQVIVDGEYDGNNLEAHTIKISGESTPKYRDDAKAD